MKIIMGYFTAFFFFTIIVLPQENRENKDDFTVNESFINGILPNGLDIEFGYTSDFWSNVSPGNSGIIYLDNFNLDFSFDFETLTGWNGGGLFLSILGNNGKDPNEQIGSIQGIDNIAAFSTWKVYQLYVTQEFADGKLSLLAGLLDLNSEFDVCESSGVFINPSHGIGPDYSLTGQNGPSIFPVTSLAFRVLYNFDKNWNFRAAVFDGVPGDPDDPRGTKIKFGKDDGALISSELTFQSNDNNYFKYSIGGWYYTAKNETVTGKLKTGNSGLYFSGEKSIFKSEDGQCLTPFVRIGFANSEVNQVNSYYGAGINYSGLFGREDDILGLAIAVAHNNSAFMSELAKDDVFIKSNEINFEFTYSLSMLEYISIQPDLQYVINPTDGDQSKNYLIAGVRLNLTF